MTSRAARATRGTAVAVFATFVASLAHTLGGGSPPGPVTMMLALGFSAPLAMLLARAGSHLVRTAGSALTAQASLHLCYAMIGGGGAVGAATSGVSHAGHAGHAAHADPVSLVTSMPAADHGHAWMPVAHLIAAAFTLAALVAGDRVFDALGRVVRGFVRRLTSLPAPMVTPRTRFAVAAARPRLVAAVQSGVLGSRGPPLEFAAA